jgi:hypothetical protein
MGERIAYCGIACSACPAFIATANDDDAARLKVARQWSKWFHAALDAGDINCDGCAADGARLFGHCRECEIRRCARDRKLENCAFCADYPCGRLTGFWKTLPTREAANNLEAIRRKRP